MALFMNNEEAICRAALEGDVGIVKALLERVDPGIEDNKPLRNASEYGHLEIIKLLLVDPRVDPTAKDNKAIALAAGRNQIEVVKFLLSDPRVDPSDSDNFALRWALANGCDETAKLLLKDKRVISRFIKGEAILEIAQETGDGIFDLILKTIKEIRNLQNEKDSDPKPVSN